MAVQRRLAAILAADVSGYSRLMGEDEEGTLATLTAHLTEMIEPCITDHRGRVVKTMGDGLLVEFASVVDAVRCALAVQEGMQERNIDVPENRRIEFRIGVNLGDVIVQDDDLYGDGVNVAARLEGLAEAGGICISGKVHDEVKGRFDIGFDDFGPQAVKNIAEPVRVFRIALVPLASKSADAPLPLSDKPSVAVLPFKNMSGDSEQEYFADGLTEDIITALSLCRTFPVIARNSTFAYKGRSPDLRTVGKELGARYIVEGSVRKAGNSVRVAAQLIDAETGHHVWAERYDRRLTGIFELQDEITDQIAAIVEPAIERTERQRIAAKPPNDLAAWEYWLRGYAYIYEETKEANEKAREMFGRAIELDPHYARAHAGLAFTYFRDLRFWPPEDREEWMGLFSKSARRAVDLDETDSEARSMLARVYFQSGDFDAAVTEARRAVELNPHRAWTNNILGHCLARSGRFEEGIPWIERAHELNPIDPRQHHLLNSLALAHLGAGHYEKTIEYAREVIRRRGNYLEPNVYLASALGFLNRDEDARRALQPFEKQAWAWVQHQRIFAPVAKERILEGLRKAGLPE